MATPEVPGSVARNDAYLAQPHPHRRVAGIPCRHGGRHSLAPQAIASLCKGQRSCTTSPFDFDADDDADAYHKVVGLPGPPVDRAADEYRIGRAAQRAISVDATTKRIHATDADFASLQSAAVRQVIAGRQAIDNYENFGGTAPTAFNNDVNQLLSSDLLVLKQAPVTASAESAAIWDAWRQLSDYATDADNVSKIHC